MASEYLAPVGIREIQRLRVLAGEAMIDTSTRKGNLGSGLWIRDLLKDSRDQLISQRFVNIRAARPDGSLSEIEIVEFDAERRVQRLLLARGARVAATPGLDLEQVHEIRW